MSLWKMGSNLCEKWEFDRNNFVFLTSLSSWVSAVLVLLGICFALGLWRQFGSFVGAERVLVVYVGRFSFARARRCW